MEQRFKKSFRWHSLGFVFFLFAFPASTNYQLKDFGYGSGGTAGSNSSNYSIEGAAGEQNGGRLDGATYDLGPGLLFTQQANVPPAPTFTNPANYYNKLKLVLAVGGNANDATFAIAISPDGFSSTTYYVQSDNTIGATLGAEDYQTYSAWGGASGFNVLGLSEATTYTVKVKAEQGAFTETSFGPVATAATVNSQLSFDIDVSVSNTDTDPPFTTHFGSLVGSSITDSPEKIWVDFTTNSENGGKVYIVASNAGLMSALTGHIINSVSGNLTSLSEGFGVQGSTVSESGGGPFTLTAAYDLSSQNVGIIDTTVRDIFTTSGPVTSGRGSFLLKAKSSAVTPAADDYVETITIIVSANF